MARPCPHRVLRPIAYPIVSGPLGGPPRSGMRSWYRSWLAGLHGPPVPWLWQRRLWTRTTVSTVPGECHHWRSVPPGTTSPIWGAICSTPFWGWPQTCWPGCRGVMPVGRGWESYPLYTPWLSTPEWSLGAPVRSACYSSLLHSGGHSRNQPETQPGCPRQCSRQNACLDDWPGRTPNPAIGAGRGSLSGRQVLPSVVEQCSSGATAAHRYVGTDLQGKSSH